MEKKATILNKISHYFFGTRAAGVYILIFAIAIAIATFIENDFGTSAAQKTVYKSWWFEGLLALFCLSLLVNIWRFKMISQKKWAVLLFHLAMIVIVVGAGVTRYFGYEGMMHIRENDSSSRILSSDTYLNFEARVGEDTYVFAESVLFASLGKNKFHERYLVQDNEVEVKLLSFIPNPAQVLQSTSGGRAILEVVTAGPEGRKSEFISQGETKRIGNSTFDFSGGHNPFAINLDYRDNNLLIQADVPLTQMTMTTQQVDTLDPSIEHYPLRLRSLYSDGKTRFIFSDFKPSGEIRMVSSDKKVKNESIAALLFQVIINNEDHLVYVWGQKGVKGNPTVINSSNMDLAISYGSKYIELPFAIKLYEFIMERYPGTNSAASYASEVQLIDSRKDVAMDYRIFMNNILNHDGYRFFQSSYDTDEKGTYLSVNHDAWGTWITYIGYGLLTLGMIFVFFSKNSRFYQVTRKLKNMQSIFLLLFVGLISFPSLSANNLVNPPLPAVDFDHAEEFSRLIVQDFNGRMKPVHTLSREVFRKMSKKESILDLSSDQVLLSMLADQESWMAVPMIKITDQSDIEEILGVKGPLVAYQDFFNADGSYKLMSSVQDAYNKQPIDRGTFEKDVMKIDERVNIATMIYSGRIFKMIPVENDPNNTWVSTYVDYKLGKDVPQSKAFFSRYIPGLKEAISSGDYGMVNDLIKDLKTYQVDAGEEIVPSATKIKTEIWLNNLNIFSRLSLFYALMGLVYLGMLFIKVFSPTFSMVKAGKIMLGLLIIGFALHTAGLGMRWYVSGRAPWSNGYESMIYIAWTSALAGLIFTRKSYGGLAATTILSGTILLVAMLSYLDPQITPLVPVLRSYWLTIHVSLIAGSYGFLMLGAIIGVINLVLMIFLTIENKKRITKVIREMTYISEVTLIGGLVMISIGTYLGGVWANESWGRYWGWDAKETWALVTILVYAFILHMRIIPKIFNLYSYNLATLFGFASVVMTYFGVNYYLSGLHSYAAGDPIPIPTWVYISVIVLAIISVLAWWRRRGVMAA